MSGQRRYRIGKAIAEGGFGTVYAADQVNPDGFTRPVAIKVLKDTDDAAQEYAQRLRDEARMLGLIRHRSIVAVHGLTQFRGAWAVAMEYVVGADLAQVMSLGPLPPTVALEIGAEVAAALHVAYTAAGPGGRPINLLHRDIKPGNIRLTPEGDVKILDFGAGRAEFSAREARTEAFTFGSMSYMAPERLDGFDSHAADVYSLGVVLFEMLTANAYGRSSAAPERHAARLREVMDHLWRATGGVSEDLVRLAGGLLAYEPTERPDARAVERFCSRLGRSLEGPLLRDWAPQAIEASLKTAPAPRDGALTGLEFTDSGLEIPAHLASAPAATTGPDGQRSDGLARAAFGADAVTVPPPELSQLFAASSAIPRGRTAAMPRSQVPKPRMAEEPSTWDRSTRRVLVAALAAALLLGAGLGVAGYLLRQPEAPTVLSAPPATLSAPRVPLSLDVPGEAEVPQDEEPAPPTSARPTREATDPRPQAVDWGRVDITGYSEEVWLVNDAGRRAPGAVPAGRYRVQARFESDDDLKTVATVDVAPGATRVLNCSKVYKNCTARD